MSSASCTDEDKVYVGAIVPVIVDCCESIVGATGRTIEVLMPDGTEVSWPADVYQDNYLKYITINEGEGEDDVIDLAQDGHYKAQARFTKDGWTGRCGTDIFHIWAKFS